MGLRHRSQSIDIGLPRGGVGNPLSGAPERRHQFRQREKGLKTLSSTDTTKLLAQLRAVLDLTNTEIQVAETRIAQARTEAVRTELEQNASNGRDRAEAIETAIRDLGGFPDVIGPFFGLSLIHI